MLKIAFPARLLAALSMAAALAASPVTPAVAQTGTGSIVTSPTRIPGDADGVVKLDAWALKVTPKLPRKTTVYGPCPGLPNFTYRVRQACPEPQVPPVVTPPPAVEPVTPPTPEPAAVKAALTKEGEVFLQNDDVSVGLSSVASIGTVTNTSPAGFRTDRDHGFNRLGWFGRQGSDVILPDAAIGGGTLYVNGVSQSAMRLRGYSGQLTGRFVDPLHWQGGALGIDVKIAFALGGKELSHAVTFTNTTSKPVTVQYQWSADPDQTDASVTTQRAPTAGTVESTLANGAGVYYLTSPEPGAYIALAATFTWTKIGNRLAVGATRKADDVVQLVSPPKLLPPGASWTFLMAQGLR